MFGDDLGEMANFGKIYLKKKNHANAFQKTLCSGRDDFFHYGTSGNVNWLITPTKRDSVQDDNVCQHGPGKRSDGV